jgi:phosphoserine aminotransferase
MFNDFEVPNDLIPTDPRFGVGPSLIPTKYIEEMARTGSELLGTSHRKPAVINLVKELQDGFRKYFNLPKDFEIVIGNGGATFLFDMIGLGLVDKASVHYTTGEFSTKWFKAHSKIPWIHATQKSTEYGSTNDVKSLEEHDMICCTLNETSTGVMISTLPDMRETDVLVTVDATSGAGQIPINLELVDLYFFSPQKVFGGEGGMYFAFMSPKAIKRSEDIAKKNTYIPEIMNWKNAIDNSVKGQTYNTPSIMNLFIINEQIKAMNLLGEREVISQAKEKAKFIYDWAESKDYLSPFVTNESERSISVATIDIDEKYPILELLDLLRDKKIVYDIEGYRKLGRNQLRISLFHNIALEDLVKLTKIISMAIESEMSEK